VIFLIDTQRLNKVFCDAILHNLHYWQGWLEENEADIAAVDREWRGIVTAIKFGFDLQDAWAQTYTLTRTFAPYMERRGRWDTWNWVLRRAIESTQELGDTRTFVDLSAIFARLLWQQSRYQESISRYRQTIKLSRQIGDLYNEARACTNLGYHFIEMGYWHRAEVLCCHALMIFEQVDNDHGRAHTENHLGVLYIRRGLWDDARQHLERACKIWQAMSDEHGLMRGLINLGLLCHEMASYNDALVYTKQALHKAIATGAELTVGSIYLNMAIAYLEKGDLVTAENYIQQADTIFQRYSYTRGRALVADNLGLIRLQQGKVEEASFHLDNALSIWRNLGSRYGEATVMIDIAQSELVKENPCQAKIWLDKVLHFIRQHSHVKRDRPLQAKIDNLRRNLAKCQDDRPGCDE